MTLSEIISEFFDPTRQPEGWFSWQHLLYSTLMVVLTVFLGVFLGKRRKCGDFKSKQKVLKFAAATMVALEIFKIVLFCIQDKNIATVRSNLPLWLCSIVLFSLPFAAFCKGKMQEGAADFTFCFGMLCTIAGSYLAGNYFSSNPILSFSPMCSVTTHCISGFACVYIGVSGLATLKKKNLWIPYAILGCFEGLSLLVNAVNEPYQTNYMFFSKADGTPFSIVETIACGHQWLYTVIVMSLYFIYLTAFIVIACLIKNKLKKVKK